MIYTNHFCWWCHNSDTISSLVSAPLEMELACFEAWWRIYAQLFVDKAS